MWRWRRQRIRFGTNETSPLACVRVAEIGKWARARASLAYDTREEVRGRRKKIGLLNRRENTTDELCDGSQSLTQHLFRRWLFFSSHKCSTKTLYYTLNRSGRHFQRVHSKEAFTCFPIRFDLRLLHFGLRGKHKSSAHSLYRKLNCDRS